MADHARFSITTGVPVYFCDPRSPWQRGSNENTNGLLRQYFPKRSEIAHYTQADLDGMCESFFKVSVMDEASDPDGFRDRLKRRDRRVVRPA